MATPPRPARRKPAPRYQLLIRATLEDTMGKGRPELAAQALNATLLLPARVPDRQVHLGWVGQNTSRQWATADCSCGWRGKNRWRDDKHGRWVDADRAQADLDAHLQEVAAGA